jgi:TolB-like protein/cytochrome c-type biogenesis protein CcmH/NrfG
LEYVSDGIAEGVTHRLSQLPSLNKVISSSSVRSYKGKEVDVQRVSRELDVRAVVIASLVQSGENVRISVELVDGRDRNILWGETYTRPRSAVYEIEEALSKEIADALGIQLTGEEGERLTRRYTENSEAHEAYLRGRAEYAKRTALGSQRAIEYFEEAILRDPGYAPAYATMAQAYFTLAQGPSPGLTPMSHAEAMPKAEEFSMKALELDRTLAEAHTTLASIKRVYHWDWTGAEEGYKQALELDPSSSWTYTQYAWWMTTMGRHDEAITLGRRALQLDPLSVSTRSELAAHYWAGRRYSEAIEQCQAALDSSPNYQRALSFLEAIYRSMGNYQDALNTLQKSLLLFGAGEEDLEGLRKAYETDGARGYYQWQLDYWTKKTAQQHVQSTMLAALYGAVGDNDSAFELLERAYEERDGLLIFLATMPFFDSLRDDPRFQDLLRRMNLEP